MVEKQHNGENEQGTHLLMKKIGDRLRFIREENRYTQKHFAAQLNISHQNLSRYENGNIAIPIQIIQKLYSMDYNINWLLCGEGPIKRSNIKEVQNIIKKLEAEKKEKERLKHENTFFHKLFSSTLKDLVDALKDIKASKDKER